MNRFSLSIGSTRFLIVMGLFTLVLAGFSAFVVLDGLQYRAIKVGADRDVDDNFNKMALDGWYPRFVLQFEGDNRLIYERPRDEDERIVGLQYKAEVVNSGKKIDDTFNKMSKDGWFPRFVMRSGLLNQNWRLLMERDPDYPQSKLEYRSLVIDIGREVDDKFNQLSVDGWYPLFVVEGATDLRMLFARDPEDTDRTFEFMAKTTRDIKEIDDLYNIHGLDRWEPMFLFKDETGVFRTLFQRSLVEESYPLEFQARRIEEISEIDDKFTQYDADGWYPLFVIRDIEELLEEAKDGNGVPRTRTVDNIRWRMLFVRDLIE